MHPSTFTVSKQKRSKQYTCIIRFHTSYKSGQIGFEIYALKMYLSQPYYITANIMKHTLHNFGSVNIFFLIMSHR